MKTINISIRMSDHPELYQRLVRFMRDEVILHDQFLGQTYEVDLRLAGESTTLMRGPTERAWREQMVKDFEDKPAPPPQNISQRGMVKP